MSPSQRPPPPYQIQLSESLLSGGVCGESLCRAGTHRILFWSRSSDGKMNWTTRTYSDHPYVWGASRARLLPQASKVLQKRILSQRVGDFGISSGTRQI